MPALIRQLWSAFLLQEEAYGQMRDDAGRLQRAALIIVVVGSLVGLVTAWNQLAAWSFSPNADVIQATVRTHLERMPWYIENRSQVKFLAGFEQTYTAIWMAIKAILPGPGALVNIITTPIALLIGWLVYGVLVHVSARLFGGRAELGQTLGCTALAVAPQLLNLMLLVPFAAVAGVGTWTLGCNYMAVKTAHRLPPWRALAATLLPLVLAVLVVVSFACCGLALIGAGISSAGGGS